jgi:hypothetical protein
LDARRVETARPEIAAGRRRRKAQGPLGSLAGFGARSRRKSPFVAFERAEKVRKKAEKMRKKAENVRRF